MSTLSKRLSKLLVVIVLACGGSPHVTIVGRDKEVSLEPGAAQALTTASGEVVSFSATCGTITQDGLYSAPTCAEMANGTCVITVSSPNWAAPEVISVHIAELASIGTTCWVPTTDPGAQCSGVDIPPGTVYQFFYGRRFTCHDEWSPSKPLFPPPGW